MLASGSPIVPAEDPEHRGPDCCAVYRGCNVPPRISASSADGLSDIRISQSRHSRRIVPSTRSQTAFAFGLRTGERNTFTPNALIESSRCFAEIRSQSCIRYRWPPSYPTSSLNCCSVHSAVGFAVTFTCFRRRVPCSITTNTDSIRNVTVTKKSHASMVLAWFLRTSPIADRPAAVRAVSSACTC